MLIGVHTSWHCERCGPVDDAPGATYRGTLCPRCNGPLSLPRAPDLSLRFECPGCQGEVAADATRCPTCDRVLGVPRCHRCHAALASGADDVCPQCGAFQSVAALSAVRGTPCPVCHRELLVRTLGDARVLACAICQGVFVGSHVLEHWTEDHAAHAPEPVEGQRVLETAVRYRRCPQCGATMNRVNFGPGSGVILDVCRTHGTWLDAGELAPLLTYARSGRLERAQRLQSSRRESEKREVKRRATTGLADVLAPTQGARLSDSSALASFVSRLLGRLFD